MTTVAQEVILRYIPERIERGERGMTGFRREKGLLFSVVGWRPCLVLGNDKPSVSPVLPRVRCREVQGPSVPRSSSRGDLALL